MTDLTVMPVTCWEEWCAIFHTTFRSQQFPVGGACEDIINPRSYEQGLAYLKIVLKRDKYKNNLSLGYTADFLTHYADIQSSTSSAWSPSAAAQIRTIGLDIVRFSSQMADMSQKKNTKSINSALGDMGMKEHDFVAEVRHALTHKTLPSLLLVKRSLVYLISFLYDTYWLPQYTQLVKSDLIDASLLDKHLRLVQSSAGFSDDANNVLYSLPQQSSKQLKRMGNIVADNLQTFRRRLNEIAFGFVKNYDGERDFIQIDNLKKKKQHLSFFISELLRLILNVAFYARQDVKANERDETIVQITRIAKDMLADAEFKKTLAKITDVSFLKYKLARLNMLSPVYEELQPLLIVFKEIFPTPVKKATSNNKTKAPEPQQPTAPVRKSSQAAIATSTAVPQMDGNSVEINKFGAFRLKTEHVPSLLGKKMLESL